MWFKGRHPLFLHLLHMEWKTKPMVWKTEAQNYQKLFVYLAKYIEHICLFDWFIFFNLPRFLEVPWRIKEGSIGNISKAFSTKEVNYKFVCWIKNFNSYILKPLKFTLFNSYILKPLKIVSSNHLISTLFYQI